MECNRVNELLVDYLYQELDRAEVAEFEAHLRTCTACTRALADFEATRCLMQGLPELEPPASITSRLLRAAEQAAPHAPSTLGERPSTLGERLREALRVFAFHPAMAAAVMLVLVVGISFYAYRQKEPPANRLQADEPVARVAPAPPPPTGAAPHGASEPATVATEKSASTEPQVAPHERRATPHKVPSDRLARGAGSAHTLGKLDGLKRLERRDELDKDGVAAFRPKSVEPKLAPRGPRAKRPGPEDSYDLLAGEGSSAQPPAVAAGSAPAERGGMRDRQQGNDAKALPLAQATSGARAAKGFADDEGSNSLSKEREAAEQRPGRAEAPVVLKPSTRRPAKSAAPVTAASTRKLLALKQGEPAAPSFAADQASAPVQAAQKLQAAQKSKAERAAGQALPATPAQARQQAVLTRQRCEEILANQARLREQQRTQQSQQGQQVSSELSACIAFLVGQSNEQALLLAKKRYPVLVGLFAAELTRQRRSRQQLLDAAEAQQPAQQSTPRAKSVAPVAH